MKVVSHRVTIAVPESLFARLQPIKDQLNISAICQDALETVVTNEELKRQAAQQDGLVERLRNEKKILLNQIRQEGFELGVRSTATLSYKEFQHFDRVRRLAGSFDDDVLDYLWAFLDTHGYPQEARTHDPDFAHLLDVSPQSRILFVQGWLDGVLSVWDQVKAQVESDD